MKIEIIPLHGISPTFCGTDAINAAISQWQQGLGVEDSQIISVSLVDRGMNGCGESTQVVIAYIKK